MALVIKTTGIEDYLDGGEAYVKALVAGPPSAGKTRSASFWPKPIYADCEKGRMSIADRKVPYGEITTTDDMVALIRALRVECQKPVASRKFQTLVIDTIDAYQRIVIQERLTSERKEAFQGYGDWGYLDAKMTQLISALLSLPMNIVVNMHVKTSQEGDDGPVTVIPKLKGDIRDQIAAEFDLVGLMGTTWVAEGGERVLQRSIQWHPDPRVPWLKDRSGQLPKFTPVSFTEEDYTGLFVPLSAALDAFEASEEVMVMEGDADYVPAPVAPATGPSAPAAAVAQPVKAPAKKAPAKAAKAPAKAVPAAPRPTMEVEGLPPAGAEVAPVAPAAPAPAPAAPGATTPVDGATADPTSGELPTEPVLNEAGASQGDAPIVGEDEPPASEEQALALVGDTLGGKVTREIIAPDEDPPVADAGPDPATAVPAAQAPSSAPATGPAAPTCGTPGKNPKGDLNPDPISGCGKSLADESRDVVNIGFIRSTREGRPTYLCAACIAAHKAASKAS